MLDPNIDYLDKKTYEKIPIKHIIDNFTEIEDIISENYIVNGLYDICINVIYIRDDLSIDDIEFFKDYLVFGDLLKLRLYDENFLDNYYDYISPYDILEYQKPSIEWFKKNLYDIINYDLQIGSNGWRITDYIDENKRLSDDEKKIYKDIINQYKDLV
jgi:hypothetical protein